MIEHIDKLAEAGVYSFKLEGRAKSTYYVSVVTNAYRMAMDIFEKDPEHFVLPQWIKDEVYKVSHRAYSTGFYFGSPRQGQYYENSGYIREYDVVAIVRECRDGRIYASQRNKFLKGDELEALIPGREPIVFKADIIYDENGEETEAANRATMDLSIASDLDLPENTILRMKK